MDSYVVLWPARLPGRGRAGTEARHVVKKGKTPVLLGEETRKLLDSIKTETVIGLRDRALIGVPVYMI